MIESVRRTLKLPSFPVKPAIFAVSWFAGVLFLSYASLTKFIYNSGISTPPFAARSLFKVTAHWDSTYYLNIAQQGYADSLSQSHLAFFPLYPALIRAAYAITGNYITAGVLVNLIATVGAVTFLFLLARKLFNSETTAWRTICIFLAFPSAYFLTAIYTESVFALFCFAAFYFAMQRRWAWAIAAAALGSATRSPGILIAIGVAVEYWQFKEFRPKYLPKVFLMLVASVSGVLMYLGYLHFRFGSPFILSTVYAQSWPDRVITLNYFSTFVGWARELLNLYRIHQFTNLFNYLLPVVSWIVAAGITIYCRKRLPLSHVVFLTLNLLLFAATKTPDSINRYILPLFPLYLGLAGHILKKDEAYSSWLVGSSALMGILLAAYATNYWTG